MESHCVQRQNTAERRASSILDEGYQCNLVLGWGGGVGHAKTHTYLIDSHYAHTPCHHFIIILMLNISRNFCPLLELFLLAAAKPINKIQSKLKYLTLYWAAYV